MRQLTGTFETCPSRDKIFVFFLLKDDAVQVFFQQIPKSLNKIRRSSLIIYTGIQNKLCRITPEVKPQLTSN